MAAGLGWRFRSSSSASATSADHRLPRPRFDSRRLGLEVHVDSAGTGDWHAGHAPDPRALAVAARNGVDISHLRARQVKPADFERFNHIVALDAQNYRDLQRLQPRRSKAALSLLLDHVPGREGTAVADPYYGGDADFDRAWADAAAGARGLALRIARQVRA
jgi:protein-tyrosine phosphatase